jgi:copper(I)-binding protein
MRTQTFGTRMNTDKKRMNTDNPMRMSWLRSAQARSSKVLSAFIRCHPCSSVFQGFWVAFCVIASPLVHAEVTVKDAWVRGTVPAQTTTGAFMTLTSTTDAKLLSAASPLAKTVEIHESMMHGSTAHMHAVEAVVLPAGKAVSLKPGGHHVMLMGLARPLKPGDTVPLTLTIEEKGKRSTLQVQAAVRPLGSP